MLVGQTPILQILEKIRVDAVADELAGELHLVPREVTFALASQDVPEDELAAGRGVLQGTTQLVRRRVVQDGRDVVRLLEEGLRGEGPVVHGEEVLDFREIVGDGRYGGGVAAEALVAEEEGAGQFLGGAEADLGEVLGDGGLGEEGAPPGDVDAERAVGGEDDALQAAGDPELGGIARTAATPTRLGRTRD